MKDKVLYKLYQLGKYPVVRKAYIQYYKFNIRLVTIILGKLSFVKHAYLKGSFGEAYFVPVLSDLDFFIIGDKNPRNSMALELIFSLLGTFFPLLSDFDFHNEKEADYLRNFSGAKFFSTSSWKTIKGDDFHFSYRFNPRKFYVDIVHEIYFQIEWLFKNINKRSSGESYKSLVIQRQYQKIKDLINYLHDHNDGYFVDKRKFSENERWADYSNSQIIVKFNALIENSVVLSSINEIIKEDFKDHNLDEILALSYYKDELEIFVDSPICTDKLHYFTKANFELFYYLGCIDSFLLWEWSLAHKGRLDQKYIEALYYARLIENRINSSHDTHFFEERIDEAIAIKKVIIENVRGEHFAPKNFLNKNVYVVVSWGVHNGLSKDSLSKLADSQSELEIFEVHLNDTKFENSEYRPLRIEYKNYHELIISNYQIENSAIDYQMSLFNLAVDWCFGAANIILADSQIYPKEEFQFKKSDHEFIHYISEDYFCWSASYINFMRLNLFRCQAQSWFRNDILEYHISGTISETMIKYNLLEQIETPSPLKMTSEKVKDIESKLFYVDHSRGRSIQKVDENKIIMLGLYEVGFKESFDFLGIPQNKCEVFPPDCYKEAHTIISNMINTDDYNAEKFNSLEIQFDEYLKTKGNIFINGVSIDNNQNLCINLNSHDIKTDRVEVLDKSTILSKFNIPSFEGQQLIRVRFSIKTEVSTESVEVRFSEHFEGYSNIINEQALYNHSIILFLPTYISTLNLVHNLNLKTKTNYELELGPVEKLSLPLESDYRFFSKIESSEQKILLRKIYRGFYKFVLNYEATFTGVIVVKNLFTKEVYQTFYIENENEVIMYHFAREEVGTLCLVRYRSNTIENPIFEDDKVIVDILITDKYN